MVKTHQNVYTYINFVYIISLFITFFITCYKYVIFKKI